MGLERVSYFKIAPDEHSTIRHARAHGVVPGTKATQLSVGAGHVLWVGAFRHSVRAVTPRQVDHPESQCPLPTDAITWSFQRPRRCRGAPHTDQ